MMRTLSPYTAPVSSSDESHDKGAYLALIEAMQKRHPNLINLLRLFQPKIRQPWSDIRSSQDCKVCMIEFSHHKPPKDVFLENEQDLQAHFSVRRESHLPKCQRVYILENLAPAYVETFGSYFGMDPSVFATQIRLANWERWEDENNTPKLPTCRNPEQSFTLRYIELRFVSALKGLSKAKNFECSERSFSFGKVLGNLDGVLLIRRCVSFYFREIMRSGWDSKNAMLWLIMLTLVIILVDPPATCKMGDRSIKTSVYQYGYVDFMPSTYTENNPQASINGPLRESAFQDLHHYLTEKIGNHKIERLEEFTALIVKKLVLSHYVAVIEYLKSLLSTVEFELQMNAKEFRNLRRLENEWTDVYVWSRRTSELCEHIESAFDTFGISQNDLIMSQKVAIGDKWHNIHDDFNYVYRRVVNIKKRTTELIGTLNDLISIVETQRSLEEATSVGTLTKLGTLFVPLAFTSGLFSMSQNYVPGGPHFWVYLVVAIPLVITFFGFVFVRKYLRNLSPYSRSGFPSGRHHEADEMDRWVQMEKYQIEKGKFQSPLYLSGARC